MANEKTKKNVLFLGLVSLCEDLSSQMVYPLMPEFLVSIGANKAIIGIIEGIAEATASVFRTVFGRLSDKTNQRKPFVFSGYILSVISRPFLFFSNTWTAILGIRFSDKLGKAIRTPARDALISTSVEPSEKGKAFGFHRAMDRVGAIGGPLLAMLLLRFSNENIRLVFLLSIIPGVLAIFFVMFARETSPKKEAVATPHSSQSLREPAFILFLVANIVFNLGNSSNAFLLLKAQEVGISLTLIPLPWVVYNIVCVLSSYYFGSLSDRIGRKLIVTLSFIYYAAVYLCFGLAQSIWLIWVLFGAYGIYYGLSEGVFRAYIADLVPPEQRATAYGIFNTGVGLSLLPASLIMGLIWDKWGSQWAFFASAFFSLLGFLIYLLDLVYQKQTIKVAS